LDSVLKKHRSKNKSKRGSRMDKKEKGLTVAKGQELMKVNITAEDIKKYFCPLATEKELFLALGIIKSLDLNPHTREVHLVKYRDSDKLSIIVGYEVYLKRAERSGNLDGWESGISEDKSKAWVKIHRKDQSVAFYWEVDISEFDKKQATWKTMPTFMAKKVAIAQGFRLCFPNELGGMPYTQEEHKAYAINATQINPKADVQMPEAKSEKPEEKEPEKKTAYKIMLERFATAREVLGDKSYYKFLGNHGYYHANEIKTMVQFEEILKEMGKFATDQAKAKKKK